MKTKIAKIIIDYFSLRGIKDVFILTGGAIAFMADAASISLTQMCSLNVTL